MASLSHAEAEASSPNQDYNFNLLLGLLLKKEHCKPEGLNIKLLKQLKTTTEDDRLLPHHKMFSGTLDNAKEKVPNSKSKNVILNAYLLDRWARVPGVRDCDALIEDVFPYDEEIQEVIKGVIHFFHSGPGPKIEKTQCDEYPHLEIGREEHIRGDLFSFCRDCQSETEGTNKFCYFEKIHYNYIEGLEAEFLRWQLKQKKKKRSAKEGDVKSPKKKRKCTSLPEPDTSTKSIGDVKSSKNRHKCTSLPEPDTSTKSIGTHSTRLFDSDLSNIVGRIGTHVAKWESIGIYLGFNHSVLEGIKANPTSINEAPKSYLREMLAEWLQWAPSDGHGHDGYATVESLQSALRKVKLGVLAEEFDGYRSISTNETGCSDKN